MGAGGKFAESVDLKDHSQASPQAGLLGSGFLTGEDASQFWLVHRLFFNNLEK